MQISGLEKTRYKKVFCKFLNFFRFIRFYVLMYEDRTQNYDQEIHKEYLIHDTPL